MEPRGKQELVHKLVFGHIRIDIASKVKDIIPMDIYELCFNFYFFSGWEWEDTLLAQPELGLMFAVDVKQLLLTRGERKQNLKGKKIDMIRFLKEKYDVALNEELEALTVKELTVELRLRNLDDSCALKKD